MGRRLVIAVFAAGALIFGALGLLSMSTAGASATTPATVNTGIISAQRVPQLLANVASDSVVRSDVNSALKASSGQTCVAVNQGGRTVVAKNADQPLLPASNLKLLTATAALNLYGPDATFTTAVKSPESPKNGVINGSLYLVGGGDPLLFTDDYFKALNHPADAHTSLEALVDSVVKAGVKTVTGGVIGDDSRFDHERYLPSWDPGYMTQGQIGPTGALQVNQGFGRFEGGRVPAPDPTLQATQAFTKLLQERGVSVTGSPSAGVTPAKVNQIASVTSPPMNAIVAEMLTESDNSTAEMILRDIGVKASNQGTFAAGITAVRNVAAKDNIPMTGVVMVDGSGLDRGNRATCNTLVAALLHDGVHGPIANGLPKAGQTGTLTDRMKNTAAVGRVEAKTGTLNGVSALAGWVTPVGGDPLAFAILNNGMSGDTGHNFEDGLAETFASLPASPGAVAYAPSTELNPG